MSDKPVIGFIGVGFMGHGMAKNVLKGGYDLWIRGNRNRAPVEDLLAQGAQEAASPKEIAERCDIVHLCLSNSPQIEQVMRAPDGILAGAREGLIVIDASTSDPKSTLTLAAELSEKGGTMVDAPLGRTPKHAEEGALQTMLGCDAATLAIIQPVVECWADTIQHMGPVGSGHKMKLLLNFVSLGNAALLAETLVLGAKIGIPPTQVREVLTSSRQNSGFMQTFMQYTVDRDRDAHKFSIANGSKDLRYVNAMAAEAGVMNVVAAAVRQYFIHAEAVGGQDDFVPMLTDHVARLNGLDMEVEAAKGR
ncbi:NAD(P)-dependent oxidoreductase [Puniceibacterium sp. IMCC21224]|uniref:NAD(P)-dependent oxidoreductase n=1 Tax=Puniceibacterium sp. IMCC21224 TaxID=1618204 RepID=UPI00064DCC44|nr:NAD(P)-dependent oxidoreductase [Puniceibacterium sp. IMCC21224]KMK64925.1 beta-hydroxyacid dehydrogenase, 3-hydroxyisobutyrate dehydrogenase [Puniceibacterium sp. IMCC21224]